MDLHFTCCRFHRKFRQLLIQAAAHPPALLNLAFCRIQAECVHLRQLPAGQRLNLLIRQHMYQEYD